MGLYINEYSCSRRVIISQPLNITISKGRHKCPFYQDETQKYGWKGNAAEIPDDLSVAPRWKTKVQMIAENAAENRIQLRYRHLQHQQLRILATPRHYKLFRESWYDTLGASNSTNTAAERNGR